MAKTICRSCKYIKTCKQRVFSIWDKEWTNKTKTRTKRFLVEIRKNLLSEKAGAEIEVSHSRNTITYLIGKKKVFCRYDSESQSVRKTTFMSNFGATEGTTYTNVTQEDWDNLLNYAMV